MEILDSLEHYYRELGFSCIQSTGQKWLELKIRERSDYQAILIVYFYNQPTSLKVVTIKSWLDRNAAKLVGTSQQGKRFRTNSTNLDLNDPQSMQNLHQIIFTHLCSKSSPPITQNKATS
jgi:hypothetical protein